MHVQKGILGWAVLHDSQYRARQPNCFELHYIQYALSVFFFPFFFLLLSPRGFLQSTVQPHQSTKMALERAASHIKVTHPPCLFQLPPWKNVKQINSTNLDVTIPYQSQHYFFL